MYWGLRKNSAYEMHLRLSGYRNVKQDDDNGMGTTWSQKSAEITPGI
jgi:hypothetical protein